jgi:hypothetical protein
LAVGAVVFSLVASALCLTGRWSGLKSNPLNSIVVPFLFYERSKRSQSYVG